MTPSYRRSAGARDADARCGSGVDVSVLLRQPEGFEGFFLRGEVAPPDALPAPRPDYVPDRLLGRGVATRALASKAHRCDRQVAKVAHFANLDSEVGEG